MMEGPVSHDFEITRSENAAPSAPALVLGPRVRTSPYYEATRRWGATAFTVYNHM